MIGLIGGTGLTQFLEGENAGVSNYSSRYGEPSAAVSLFSVAGQKIAFLPRHGHPHKIPPHRINYRANLDVLAQAGVKKVVAVNAVGGIHKALGPAKIAIPDQVIDYTYGREHTYFDGESMALDHVDFSYPYDEPLRLALLKSAEQVGIEVMAGGTYAATQGPRLETAAEIRRIRQDGGDMVGMTGMPEAALARELDLEYACLALSVNLAAGISPSIITMEDIEKALAEGMADIHAILRQFLANQS